MNLAYILTGIVILVVLYELIEHIIFPLVWSINVRNMKPIVGIESMIGKEVEVKRWNGTNGIVIINGKLWKAHSGSQLLRGDKAIINKADGLLLIVKPRNDD